MRGIVTLILTVAVSGIGARLSDAQPAMTGDDGLVFRAIIEHTILPEVRRSGGDRAKEGIALVAGQSISLCSGSETPPCRIPERWAHFLTPDVKRGWPGLITNDAQRKAVVASLEARNAAPQPLPSPSHPLVVLTAAGTLSRDMKRSLANVIGITSLSMPGYSGDGLALVYGSYGCGSLCGVSWLFVVRKVGDGWQVESATVTAIS